MNLTRLERAILNNPHEELHLIVQETPESNKQKLEEAVRRCALWINYRSGDGGHTALHLAVRHNNTWAVSILVQNNASPIIPNDQLLNPWQIAEQNENKEILEIFRSKFQNFSSLFSTTDAKTKVVALEIMNSLLYLNQSLKRLPNESIRKLYENSSYKSYLQSTSSEETLKTALKELDSLTLQKAVTSAYLDGMERAQANLKQTLQRLGPTAVPEPSNFQIPSPKWESTLLPPSK